jgi:hypothetical protein
MTREEAIEAMMGAAQVSLLSSKPSWSTAMTAALDAALPWVEGLVREGAKQGWDNCRRYNYGEPSESVDAIVARVMEGK